MNRSALALSGVFCLLIFGVGLVQAGIEMASGEHPQALDLFTSAPTEQHLRVYEKELEDSSWLSGALRPWVQYARFRVFGDLGDSAIRGREGWLFYRPDVDYLVQAAPDMGAVAAITAYKEALSQRGIALLVVPVPGKPGIYPDKLTVRAASGQEEVRANTRETIARLRANGVEVLDIAKALLPAEVGRSEGQTYLVLDTHWSPLGMRIAAEATAGRLLELGWITRGERRYTEKPVRVARQGDVLKMVRAEQIAGCFAAQEMVCEQIVDVATGEPYVDEAGSEVLVLGDSFLRIYERDAPGAAGFVAHLARELGNPVASIVNDGGASTLVRQELARRGALLTGKKVVVWEFVERDLRFGTEGWQTIGLPDETQPPR